MSDKVKDIDKIKDIDNEKKEPEFSEEEGEVLEPELLVEDGEAVEPELLAEEGEALEPELSEEEGEALEPELSAEEGEALEMELSAEEGEALEPELLAEEGEEIEELSEEEREEKRRKRNKILKIVGGSVAGVILAVYLGFAAFFLNHFYFNTTINGMDFSMQPIRVVEEYMSEQVEGYELTLKEADGDVVKLDGDEISLEYRQTEELSKILKSQNPFLWPMGLWEESDLTASIGVSYDETKLNTFLDGLDCVKEENQVAPVSAVPEFRDGAFVVKPEEVGSTLEMETFKTKVAEYINGFKDTLDMVKEGCYVKAKFLQDSPEVLAACEEMNQYLGAEVTYTFGDATEKVDGSVIAQWLSTDENMAVVYNSNGPAEFVASLAEKYDTYKKERSFTSGNGNTVSVKGGSYGWRIDQKTEAEALAASVANDEVITKEPAYLQTAASHSGPDWGNTYVEVDLTRQYMYLFVNGQVVVESHIVTGKPSTGGATPQGAYAIRYCQSPARLRGPKQPDGSYEWDSPVSFWMPFNGGIGLHDATWQSAFGGNRYITHGSHGCVNLPYNVAKTVYNNVSAGTPVICHY